MSEKAFPVVEIFGPTIQGEGVDQGASAHFVRFGGCDYACDWCDTPHAVLAQEVRKARRMTTPEIVQEVVSKGVAQWVVLSGGNPALHDLEALVVGLKANGYRVAVETQGSKWKDWFNIVDRLCISPKPPSSLMKVDRRMLHNILGDDTAKFYDRWHHGWAFLKVVCFTRADFEFARTLREQYPTWPMYLSAGNDAGRTVGNPDRRDLRTLTEVRNDLLNKARWLTELVLEDPWMCRTVIVQNQFHVGIWGNELGR